MSTGDKHEPANADAHEFEQETAAEERAADADAGHDAQQDENDDLDRESDLKSQVADLRDALLRTRAEMDNMHKRSQRELDRARRFQVEALMRDLLPVIDGLEQGLENAASEDEQSREGLELTHRLLVKALEQHGLEVIDPAGEPFDPEWHEAMSVQPSAEAEPDSVVMVLQKGYRLHDRLLRAARVIVAKPADESGNGD